MHITLNNNNVCMLSCIFLTSQFLMKVTWLHNFPLHIPAPTLHTYWYEEHHKSSSYPSHVSSVEGVNRLQEPYILPYKSAFFSLFSHKLTFGCYEFGRKYKKRWERYRATTAQILSFHTTYESV